MEPVHVTVNVRSKQNDASEIEGASPLVHTLDYNDNEDDHDSDDMVLDRDEIEDDQSVLIPGKINVNNANDDDETSSIDSLELPSGALDVDIANDLYEDPKLVSATIDWNKFGEIHELHDQLNELRLSAVNKDAMIEKLQNALIVLQEEMEAIEGQDSQGIAKDFAKKNKDLRLQISRETAKTAQLQGERNILNGKVEELTTEIEQLRRQSALGNSEIVKQELQDANDLCEKSQSKIAVLNAQINQLKMDIGKLKRVLKKEIGNDDDFRQALLGKETWRGRSEQIAQLQSKLDILRARMRQRDRTDTSSETLKGLGNAFDVQHRIGIQKVENQRRQKHALLVEQFDIQQKKFDALKQKHEGMSTRNRNIENEMVTLREQLKTLLSKSDNDDTLIDGLQASIVKEKKKLKLKQKEIEQMHSIQLQSNQLEESNRKHLSQIQSLKSTVANLEIELTDERNRRCEAISASAISWDRDECCHRLQFCELENAKLQMVIREVRNQRDVYEQRVRRLEQEIVAANQSRSLKSKNSKSRSSLNDSMQALEEAHINQLRNRDHEVILCHQMVDSMKKMHGDGLNALRDKILSIRQSYQV